jgi:hypothetical protein
MTGLSADAMTQPEEPEGLFTAAAVRHQNLTEPGPSCGLIGQSPLAAE